MKKILYLSALLTSLTFISNTSFAQIRKIPAEVTESLNEKYPDATNVEWRDRLTGFTASFTLDSVSYSAAFDNKGVWESTEQEIDEETLPQAVSDGFEKSKFAEWTISQVSRIELPSDEVQNKRIRSKEKIPFRATVGTNRSKMPASFIHHTVRLEGIPV